MGRRRIKTDPGLRAALDKELNGNTLSYIDNGYDEDEYEKTRKAYDLAMRIAAADDAFSSDVKKTDNMVKAYSGAYTGKQDPMHTMFANRMGELASTGVKGAADQAYNRIIKDAGEMADNGDIRKEDAEKIIRKAEYNKYYRGRYTDQVKKAGEQQAEYFKNLGISNKEYPWHVKYGNMSSDELKAASEAADMDNEEMEWLKNRYNAVRNSEYAKKYAGKSYSQINDIISKGKNIINTSDGKKEGTDAIENEYEKFMDWGPKSAITWDDVTNGKAPVKFGNVDMDRRPVIRWDENTKKKYAKELASWKDEDEKGYDPEPGKVDTVYGGSSRFGENLDGTGWEIAYTPILSDGTFMGKDRLYDYINKLVEKAYQAKIDFTEEDLLKLDNLHVIAGVDKSTDYDNDGNSADVAGRAMHFVGKYGAVNLAGTANAKKKDSSYTYGNDDLNDEEIEWLKGYAESIKKPEDYDTEIYEKWKTLKDLEDRYGYDEATGRFKDDGSGMNVREHVNRNNMLNEIISARENLDRIRNQKNKRAGDLKKEEYYNSLKDNTDYGIYAGRNLPASYYAADIDVDQMTPYEGAGLDSRYDMEGKEENTPVVAGNELVMSDEEKKNYNYLYHTQGEKAAKDYLSFIQEDLNRRRAEITAGNVNGYGTAMLYSLGTGWNRGLPDAMSKLSNLFGGDEAIPVTEDEYVNSILSEKYKDAGPKLFGRSIGQMGLETTENIGNMLPSMIASSAIGGQAGPIVGAVMMGISAGANTANEAWRDGNDRSRSIAYGLVNGMLEGGLQYALGGIASFGGAVSGVTKNALKSKMSGTLGKILMNLGVSGLSEGTEEYLQEVLDPIVRNQLLGEKNEMKFMTDDALYSGFQGALTSWILGGAGDISTAVNETRLTKLGKEMRSSEDAYIDAARQYGLTDSIEEYESSKKTDLDYGKLVRDVKTAAANNINEQFVSGIGRDHAEKIGSVIEAAEDMNLNNLIKDYNESDKTDHDTGEFVLGVQAAIGNDILNAKSMDKANKTYAKMTEGAPEYVTEVADKALSDRLSAEIMSSETIEEAQKLYNSNVTENTPDIIRQAADNAIAEKEIEDARDKANKAFGVDKMSENTQNVKREMAKSTNTDPDQFSDGFNYYYAYGRSGESYERAVNADENTGAGAWALTESEKRLAWEQGRLDLESAYENKAPGSRVEGIVRKMDADEFSNKQRANGMREVRDGEVSKDIQTAIRGLSVINGVNTVLYASDEVADGSGRNIGKTAPNGWYDRNTNTIYLDVTADNAGKNAVMMVYAHEFTHSLQENAPKEYKALRDYIVKTFENSGKTLDGLIEDHLALANLNGVELTREKAVDEVIADACQELFKNSKAIEDLAQDNPGLFGKIRDFIKKAIASIRKVLKDSETTSEEAEMLRSILGDLTEAQRLYDDAVKAAATRETVEETDKRSDEKNNENSVSNMFRPSFFKEFDNWYEDEESSDVRFILGTTSNALKKVGVKDGEIAIDSWKIRAIMNDHPEMGVKEIKKLPELLEHPIIIMESNSVPGRIVLFGDVSSKEGPIMAALELNPTDRGYVIDNLVKIVSAYTRTNTKNYIEKGSYLWIYDNIKKTNDWLKRTGLQLPVQPSQYGLIKKISQPAGNVNNQKAGKAAPTGKKTVNSTDDNNQHSFRQTPTTDTKGRKLSKGQSSYFKDSAVRDESGNLIVMYHGTPYGGFTVFRNGLTYFTPNKEYADRYHNPSASSVRGRYEPATKEQTYEVYLNITKPFDIRNAEDRKIFIDEYVKGGYAAGINPYLNRSEIEKQIADGIDWMEADNLYEFIMDNEYDYDGLVLNEGADGGYGNDVAQRGLSYVTFSPEQAKDVTNLNPTKNKDIYFSLRAPVERSGDLVAYHNISVDKLAKALNLGGLAAPSLAVTKRGMKHTGFGDITLIAPRDLIDPETNSNASIYTRDAWTPTVPDTVIKLDDKAVEDASKKLGMSAAFLKGNLEGVRTEKDAVERLKHFIQAKRAFVKEKGYEVEPVLHDAKTDYLDVKELQDYIREENITAGRIMNDENVRKNILKTVEDSFENKTGKTAKFIKNAKIGRLNELFERLANTSLSEKYFDKISEEIEVINGKTGKVMTENSYEEGLDNLIQEKSDEYEAFISDAVSGMIESEWIEKSGVEPYYQDGTRKSWNQLYRPLTLDNLVLEMKNQPDQGAGSYANIKGMAAEKMSSVEEARARESQLEELTKEELGDINREIFEKTKAITDKIMNKSEFASMFDVEEDIVESLQNNDTRDEVYRDLVRFYPKLTPAIVDEIYDLIDFMRGQPVSYFEAKVMDAVGLEQFEAAVVPENLPQEMKDALKEKGLEVMEYDPESEENRVEVMNEAAEDYQFSLRNPNSPRKILADALDSAAQTDEEKRLLKEYKSDVTQLETLEYLVGEMERAAGAAQTAGERDGYLQKAEIYRKCVQNADKKLLKLEVTKPLKNVMEREAEARKKEGAEGIMKRYATRDERRRMREIRDRSKTEIAALTRMITKPTKKDYVPDVLKKTVGDFIQSIDFVSKYADPNSWNTEQWRGKMERLSKVLGGYKEDGTKADKSKGETGIGTDPTMFAPDLLDQIDAFIENNTGKNISDLDSAALTDLYLITRKLRMGIRNYNRMFINKRYESAEKAGYGTIEDLRKKRNRSENGIAKTMHKTLGTDMLQPNVFFKRLGEAAYSIYEGLRNGQNRKFEVLRDATEFFNKTLDELGIGQRLGNQELRSWTNKKNTYSFDINGKNVNLNIRQIMSLYLLHKRPDAKEHLIHGGIVVRDGDVTVLEKQQDGSTKEKKLGEKVVKLFQSDIDDIISVLNAPEYKKAKQLADAIQKYFATTLAEYGNEVSMRMYGYRNFTDSWYFPMKVYDASINTKSADQTGSTNLYSIMNMGMTKTTQEGARNALYIDDIVDVFASHVNDMSKYYGYAMPMADALKWFNYRYENSMDFNAVKEEIKRTYGEEFVTYFTNLISDINGESIRNNSNWFAGLAGAYKAAAVGANVRVVIQQPLSIIRARNIIDSKYILKGIAAKNNIKELVQYCPIAWWKNNGMREDNIGASLRETITGETAILSKDGFWEWLTDKEGKVTDLTLKPAEMMDRVTWGAIWNAVKFEMKDRYGNLSHEEFMQKCAERFTEVIDETQVVDTTLFRSQIMRSKNAVNQQATAFMMEPIKTYNMLYDALASKDGKKIRRATLTWIQSVCVMSAALAAYDSLRGLIGNDDEKEKEFWERYRDNLWKDAINEANVLNLVPYIKDIPDVIRQVVNREISLKGNAQRFDIQWIYDAKDSLSTVMKYFEDRSDKNKEKMLKSAGRLLSNVTGIPFYNAYRESMTFYNTTQYDFAGRLTMNEKLEEAARYRYDGNDEEYLKKRNDILESENITEEELDKKLKKYVNKIREENGEKKEKETEDDVYEKETPAYDMKDVVKQIKEGRYSNVQDELDDIYSSGHPVTEEQKADYFDSKSKSFKSSLGKLLYKDPEDKDGDGKISKEEKADKVLAADYEKKKEEYLKLKIDGRPLFDEDYFLKIEKKDRKNNFDAALEAAGESADTGASAQNIQSIINEMYDSEKPDNKKAEVDYKKKKKSSIKSSLTAYYKSQPADVRAKLKVIYKKLYISGSKIKLYDNKSFVTMEKAIKAKEKEAKKTG